MKCPKCNSGHLISTDDEKIICRKCSSVFNNNMKFLHKMKKGKLIQQFDMSNFEFELNETTCCICCFFVCCCMFMMMFFFEGFGF